MLAPVVAGVEASGVVVALSSSVLGVAVFGAVVRGLRDPLAQSVVAVVAEFGAQRGDAVARLVIEGAIRIGVRGRGRGRRWPCQG